MPYSLSVTEGSSYNLSASDTSSSLSLSLTGPSGPSGPAGLPDALTFEGADPNVPQTITVAGTLTDGTNPVVFPTLLLAGYTFAGTAPLYTSHGGTYGLPNEYYLAYDDTWELVKVASGAIVAAWVDDSATVDITAIDNDFVPQGTAVGYPDITTGLSLQGTYLGQLCLASGGWWKWNGDVWEEEASSISNAAVLAALPSSTPLPITSGGTGAANLDALQPKITSANASTTRTALGSKAIGDALFQAQTVADVALAVGGAVKTEIFLTSGTWTKAPGAKLLKIIVVGGGGGGGGGSTGAAGTNRRGGGGGSGGGVAEVEVFATDLPDSLPVTVGAGAPGGSYGGNGGVTSFGSYFGRGGSQGNPGNVGGTGGGQVYSASVTVGHTGVSGATGGLPTGSSNTLNKRFGISGGGGGGGITDANVRGAGGTTSLQEGSALDPAAAYAPQFPPATTTTGQAGGAGVKLHVLGFGGGGGGAAGDTAGTINGGAGGTGVAGGGGGGGGSATSPATAGAGGPGGAGFVLIQTYF